MYSKYYTDLQFKSSMVSIIPIKNIIKRTNFSKKENNPNSLTRELTRHAEILSENTLNYNKNFNETKLKACWVHTSKKNDRYDAW